jgi:hypothetical protein
VKSRKTTKKEKRELMYSTRTINERGFWQSFILKKGGFL